MHIGEMGSRLTHNEKFQVQFLDVQPNKSERSGAVVARQTHNLKAVGSNPSSATIKPSVTLLYISQSILEVWVLVHDRV